MADRKRCSTCDRMFQRNPKYSAAQWNRATYCSNLCRGKSLAVERVLCACRCGERVSKSRTRYRPGHNPHPERRKAVKFDGRRWYVHDRMGRKVYWARVVMMGEIGRELLPGEVVHHVNGDREDDRPSNLALYASHAAHMRDEYVAGNLPAMN